MEEASAALFLLLDDILVKSNPDKCQLLMSANENITVKNGEYGTVINECEKLLAVKLEWKLNFDYHSSDICKKAGGKQNVLARTAPFIG